MLRQLFSVLSDKHRRFVVDGNDDSSTAETLAYLTQPPGKVAGFLEAGNWPHEATRAVPRHGRGVSLILGNRVHRDAKPAKGANHRYAA